MKILMKKAAYEVKEFLFYFLLFFGAPLCLFSGFLTIKGIIIVTGVAMIGFFILCVVCYCLQTRREKKTAAKAKLLKRSEI